MKIENLPSDTPDRLRMRDREESDRPREKMLMNGQKSLTSAELLAILIGSGNKDESAVELAQRILRDFDNNLNLLSQASIHQLTHDFRGIGEAKAVTIFAGLELGRRLSHTTGKEVESIKNSEDIYKAIKPHILGNTKEEVWVIYMNAGCKIIKIKKFGEGGLTCCIVDVKLIIREAFNLLASGIILVHNHPSGNLVASHQDKNITSKILQACRVCDITLIDHLIVADNGFYSFFDAGELI